MYNRDGSTRVQKMVESALDRFAADPASYVGGYDIMRYAQQGLIAVTKDVDPQIFVDWYPLNQGYVILRLAKQGKLQYRQCVKE